jgi:Galactose oxidase, central domain
VNASSGSRCAAFRPIRGLSSLLPVLVFFAFQPFASAKNAAEKVHVLLPNATGADLAAIKQDFENGEIVEMEGSHHADFDSLLDIALPDISPVTNQETIDTGKRSISYGWKSTPTLRWEAARVTADGVHLYECARSRFSGVLPGTKNPKNCATSLAEWIAEEQNVSAQAVPEPYIADWTALGQISIDYADDYLTFENRFRLLRLNDLDATSDWYMMVRDPLSAPNYQGCTVPFGSCGWYTNARDFQISLDRSLLSDSRFKLYEWSPAQEIKSGTGELSLGISLESVVPKPGVGYTFSWDQSDVITTVYSAPANKEASWVEAFKGNSPVSVPPITSTYAFLSHQGVIFQVPEGTQSISATANTHVKLEYNAVSTRYFEFQAQPTLHLAAPRFSTNLSTLSLLQNSTGLVYLTSLIPHYSQRLRWTLVSKPDWLDVSPTEGAQSTYLEIRDNGAAEVGNIGYVELQTNPAYGAPSVATGPLRVKVQVVAGLPPNGVLLAGGRDASGAYLKTAEVWSPATHTTTSTYPMATARAYDTATRLQNGTILVAGGFAGEALYKAEIFDPNTAGFRITGSMYSPRYDHNGILFPNGPLAGKVLIVGGCCDQDGRAYKTAELYDPATETFTLTGSMATARMNATATLLDNGQVLIAGGAAYPDDYFGTATAELYDPWTGMFKTTGAMNQARRSQSAAKLGNGQVLITGGYSAPDDPLKSAEIYNPGDGQFVFTGSMPVGRRLQASTLLPNGEILVGGGWNGPNSAVLFDVNTGQFTGTNNTMSEYRSLPRATLIINTGTAADGKVLFAGGAALNESTLGGRGLDLFNPATLSFESGGFMTTARDGMTATAFGDNQ